MCLFNDSYKTTVSFNSRSPSLNYSSSPQLINPFRIKYSAVVRQISYYQSFPLPICGHIYSDSFLCHPFTILLVQFEVYWSLDLINSMDGDDDNHQLPNRRLIITNGIIMSIVQISFYAKHTNNAGVGGQWRVIGEWVKNEWKWTEKGFSERKWKFVINHNFLRKILSAMDWEKCNEECHGNATIMVIHPESKKLNICDTISNIHPCIL